MWEWFSIVFASFLLEDPTTLLVATRVHDGELTWAVGGSALLFGISVGDIGLYIIGYLARIGVIKKDLSHIQTPVTGWYIFWVRFIPGLRVVVYTTSGFFKYPFLWFFVLNTLSCIIWSVLLIVVGAKLYEYTGWWGVGGVVAGMILWQLGRRYLNGRKKPDDLSLL